jgi:hypothetical protein
MRAAVLDYKAQLADYQAQLDRVMSDLLNEKGATLMVSEMKMLKLQLAQHQDSVYFIMFAY